MADISKLKLNNNVYNIKDSVARNLISELPDPMIFKGTVGINATVGDLPEASDETIGNTYKVISDGSYAGIYAKVGDLFICNDTPEWVLVPSGDDSSGTVTNVATGTGLVGGPITTSGVISVDFNTVQGVISDLATIRSGAIAGATAIQSGDNVSELNNDSGYLITSDFKTINNTSIVGTGNIEVASYTAGDGIDLSNSTISNTAGMYLTSTIVTAYSAHTGTEQVGPDSAIGLHYKGVPTIFEKNILFNASNNAIELYINGVKQNDFTFTIQSVDQGIFRVNIGSSLCFINYPDNCSSYEPDTTYELRVDTSKVKTETVLIENTYEKPTFTLTDVSLWEEVLADVTSELPGESGALSSDYKLYYECGPYSGTYSGGQNLFSYHGNGGYFLTIENESLSLRVETATGRVYFSPDWSSYEGDNFYIKFTHMRYPQYNPINTIHSDEGREMIVYPRTKVEAISNASNVPLTTLLNNKQDTLVSGSNIKTINNNSLLGSGDISISSGDINTIESISVNGTAVTPDAQKNVALTIPTSTGDLTNNGDGTQGSLYATQSWVQTQLDDKQDKINVISDTTSTSSTISTAQSSTLYIFTQPLTSLTVSLVEDGPVDIIFKSGTTPTVLSLPSTVTQPADFTVEANKTYELNIMYNLLVVAEWEA